MRLFACLCLAPAALVGQQFPEAATRIVTDFGGAAEDPAAEMLAVQDVVRARDGSFVVVNGKPLEVRRYDSRGRLLSRFGRSGSGPGEFRYSASLDPWPGDSILTFSMGSRRWMLFGLDGALIREWPQGDQVPLAPMVRLFGSAFVRTEVGQDADCVAASLRRLAPPRDTALQEAMVDASRRIWLRIPGEPVWRVYTSTGQPVARVAEPRRFAIHQVDGGDLIGVRIDEDDFPHVVVVRPVLPAAPRAAGKCAPTAPTVIPRAADLKTEIRNLMTAQEAFYSRNRRYAGTIDEFGAMYRQQPGLEARILTGGDRGFSMMVRAVAEQSRCMSSVGEGLPGWPDGYIGCGQ